MTKRTLKNEIERLSERAVSDLSPDERHRLSLLAHEHGASKLDELLGQSGSPESTREYSVAWREAAPETRPEGIHFDAESETLTYDLWEAQRRCLDALTDGNADLVAFLGGYGTGKSILGARWLIAMAATHPGSHFLAMGQSFSEARDSTFKILFNQLPGKRTAVRTGSFNGPEESPLVADYNRSARRLTLTNDTVITLGSADRLARYAGTEFGGIWLDEPSHYETDLHDLLEMLVGRLRGVDGSKVQCWTLTGNGYNDAWEILEQRQDKTGDPIGLEIEPIRASTLDNPYLDDGTLERYKRQFANTERADQALYGGFAAAQGLVYSEFQRDTHVIPHTEALERRKEDWRIYGYDAGWNNPRVVLEIGQTEYGQLVVLDEFYERETHVEDAVRWLTSHDKPKGTMYAEHEPTDISKFRRAGYPGVKAKKNLDPGIADVRKRLEADTNERVGLLVSDRCDALIREFFGYKMEHVGGTDVDDHCLDALRYAIHTARERGKVTGMQESSTSTSSAPSSVVIKSGTERARRRDRYQSTGTRRSRLQQPQSIDEVLRRQSR